VCDSLSGRGLDDVRRVLDEVLVRAPSARDLGRPRLWVDRVFAAKGAGTVVTGTLTGGSVSVDDELEVGGRGTRVRVRGIESAKRQHAAIGPGNRVALNLAGIDHHELARGDALVRPGQWATPLVVDVAVRLVPGEKIARRSRVQVYVGSGEHGATLRVLDPDGRFARVRLTTPLPLAPGDRMVLRDPGRGRTVAGVEVLDVAPARKSAEAAEVLRLPLGERLVRAHHWVPVAELPRVAGLPDADVQQFAGALVADGLAEQVDDWLVDPVTLAHLRDAARARVDTFHRETPNAPGIELGALARALREDPARLRVALGDAPGLVVERGVVHDVKHIGAVAGTPEAAALVARFAESPYAPPAAAETGAPIALVRACVREGMLVDVDGTVFAASALESARARVIDLLAEKGTITVADVRDALGSSRKFTLPIVNWLDRTGVTRRRGDDRIPGPTSGLT
jgi:selenocysteine-specific elongation factor